MTWTFPPESEIPPDLLAWAEDDLLARLLVQRGITSVEAARSFINPDNYEPAPASDLPDIDAAVALLSQAIERQIPICVWGDFDVDGQTSTALLVSILQSLGANVSYYIPNRLTEGHGINLQKLTKILKKTADRRPPTAETTPADSQPANEQTIHPSSFILHPSSFLFLTCDTGIEAHDAVEVVHRAGAKIIITDHHDPGDTLPPAEAVINPKRLPANHPLRELPGVGVAYKLTEALTRHQKRPELAEPLLDLVALGIVADVAIQTGDTRYLLQRGLAVLRRTKREGLLALIAIANLEQAQLTAEHIGFWLGPRLNALGRLGDANQGVELLTTQDKGRSRILAAQLDALNERRKLLVDRTVIQALGQLADTPSLAEYNAIVLAAEEWHPGVIGIACSRLVEQYNRPVILLTLRDGLARGSARSVAGCDIHQAIKTQAKLLNSFGGHPMAAGMSLHPRHLNDFRQGLSAALAECVSHFKPELTIDAVVQLPQLTIELLNTLKKLAPFGAGNPPITLAVENLSLSGERIFGRARAHRKVDVFDSAGNVAQLIWWNGVSESLPEGRFDLALTISKNHYCKRGAVQLIWRDIRLLEELAVEIEREVIDLRQEANVQYLLDEPDALFWTSEAFPDIKRYTPADPALSRADKLVLWQAPPGQDILQQIIGAVNPQKIYLVARPSRLDSLPEFMSHLMGVIKYALARYGGRLDIAAIANAMGHREATVRQGIDWLVNRGKLRVIAGTNEILVVRRDNTPPLSGVEEQQASLLELLHETAAYRHFVHSAKLETLGMTN